MKNCTILTACTLTIIAVSLTGASRVTVAAQTRVTSNAAPLPTAQTDSWQFRKIMAGLLSSRFDSQQMAQIVYSAPKRLDQSPTAATPLTFINQVAKNSRGVI